MNTKNTQIRYKSLIKKRNNKLVLCVICGGPVYYSTPSNTCSQQCFNTRIQSYGLFTKLSKASSLIVPDQKLFIPIKDKTVFFSRSSKYDRRISVLGKGSRQKLIAYLIQRDRNRCQIPDCVYPRRQMGVTKGRRPSIDHIMPLSKGGTNELSNVQLAHLRCNIVKHNRVVTHQLAWIG